MAKHGGRREGAGRKPELDAPRTMRCEILLAESELAELADAAGDEPLAAWIRGVALAMARKQLTAVSTPAPARSPRGSA